MGWLNLIGDAIHNFIDGVIVAIAFIVSIKFGVITALVVILHEIPQEMGDFGVLVYSGFSVYRALFFNFLSALTAIIGVVATYVFSSSVEGVTAYLVPFAAGGFIYIAMTDLMAEMKEEKSLKLATLQLAIFLLGIAIMWIAKVTLG